MSYQKRRFQYKTVLISLFFIIFCLSVLNSTLFNKTEKVDLLNREDLQKFTPRIAQISERIHINNNWSEAKNDGICTGSGTFSDPYIIQDFIIDGEGTVAGILINNSKKLFFRIENCTIFNSGYGIQLDKSCNGTLLNNNCSNNNIGIYLDGWTDKSHFSWEEYLTFICKNNTLANNIVNHNGLYGIHMRRCWNNTIINNIADYNKYGLHMTYLSDANTIIDNSFNKNGVHGIYIDGPGSDNILRGNIMKGSGFNSIYSYFLSNTVDTTNLVNDGPLYFYFNRTDLKYEDFSNAGQINLINCNNSFITHHDLSDGSVSISLVACNNLKIGYNNLSSNSFYGIDLLNCTMISIIGNEISRNHAGIEARNVNNSTILENEVNFNLEEGIYMSSCNNNSILKNNINSNGFRAGIRMFGYCSDNLISDNRFKNNFWEGLSLALYSSNNIITENIFKSNRIGVDFDVSCVNNKFYLNFFIDSEEIHVSEIPITNTWNTTYIGNYWDNYTGSDNNGDGIGDTPHLIDYSSLISDYLPIVDDLAPIITINTPRANQKYNIFVIFNVKIDEDYIDLMWYTLDGGLNNYTFTENATINQNAWDSLQSGSYTLQFYVMDKTGKIGFAEVVIIKTERAIPGYDLLLLMICSAFLSITIKIKIKDKILRKNDKKSRGN